DRLRIRQVLLNLLANAARFTERGRIAVSATAERDRVTVQVRDTGRGIGPEELPRVFEEVHHDGGAADQLPAALGRSGLGLPISKRFVELHGGTAGVESEPGVGTTFWFTLPIASRDGDVAGGAWRPARGLEGFGARERVLVLAGADGRHVEVLQRYLRGYRVV